MMRFLFVLSVLIFLFVPAFGQSTNKTIVLVRHVEKDTSVASDPDPGLSAEGKARALRLLKAVRRYKPHEIFATEYRRTRETVEPVAAWRRKQIQIYDPAKGAELKSKIMASGTDHYLIAGHSNTIPQFANVLAGKQLFRTMDDAEFGVIYVVRFKKGVFRKIEIFAY